MKVELTFGFGEKAVGATSNKLVASQKSCMDTDNLPYSFFEGLETILSATSFCNIICISMIHSLMLLNLKSNGVEILYGDFLLFFWARHRREH